jgi:hypothetical protein
MTVPAGATEGYLDSEQYELDFLRVLLGQMRPVDMIEKADGTAIAAETAIRCSELGCEDCAEWLAERGTLSDREKELLSQVASDSDRADA